MAITPHTTVSPTNTGTAAKLPTGRPRQPEYWEQTSQQARGIYQTGQTGGGQTIDLTAIAEKQTEQQKAGEERISQYIEKARAEREQIRADVMQERGQVLSSISEQFGAVRRGVDVLVQGRVAEERTMATEAARNYQERMASLGHPVSPGTQLQMSRRLAAGSASRVSQFAAQQEQMAQARETELLRFRDAVFQATRRETPSDLEIAQTAQALGGAAGATAGRTRIGGRSRLSVGRRERKPSRVLTRKRGIPTPGEEFAASRAASGYKGPGATPRGGTPSPYIPEDEFEDDFAAGGVTPGVRLMGGY